MTEEAVKQRDTCVFCQRGTWESADEQLEVPSNVRVFHTETFPVWRCSHCRSLHSLNVVDLDHYYAHYPRRDGGKPTVFTRCAYRKLARQLEKAGIKRNQRILDYGCGNGDFVEYLRSQGYTSVRGYDPYVDRYQSKQVLEEGYDLVIAKDVFEHVEDGREVLSNWKGLLKPGGILCLTMPNADGISLKTSGMMSHVLHQPYHLHIPSIAALSSLGAEIGLEVISIKADSYWDTRVPTVNRFFVFEFLQSGDDTVDVAFEKPRLLTLMRMPRLWFYAVFGYFLNNRSELLALFRA